MLTNDITGVMGAQAAETGDPVARSVSDKEKLDEELNRFMNLLVTQLKNQDPLDPMDANEFTNQLVQFASVEQQIYQNANLEKLLKVQESSQIATMVNYIGTEVEVEGEVLPLQDGAGKFTYTLSENAKQNTITITNAAGHQVYNGDGETAMGMHTFEWDGLDKYGIQLPDGAYTIKSSAVDPRGNLLDVSYTVFGRVTGGASDDGEVSLFMDDVQSPMNDVLSVNEAKKDTTTE